MKTQLSELTTKYITETLPKWKRYNVDTGETNESAKILTRDKCISSKTPYDDKVGQVGFDRLGVILGKNTNSIYIYPPINGVEATLQSILDHIGTNNINTNAENVIIFSPPHFDMQNPSNAVNKNIMANMISLIFNSKAEIYWLTHNTDANKMVGCSLQIDTAVSAPLVNMLEPTYIVYPFTRTVFKDGEQVKYGNIIFSGAAENEVTLPASSMQNICSISTYVSENMRYMLAYPPDIRTNDVLKTIYQPLEYRFYGPKATIFENNIIHISLKEDTASHGAKLTFEFGEFIPTDEEHLIVDNVDTVKITFADGDLDIRKPLADVRKNWLDYKFTNDEADLLNSLHITPDMLDDPIFDGMGQEKLVGFLSNITHSKCFKEYQSLTDEECGDTRDFMDRAYGYLLENDPRIKIGEEKKKRVLSEMKDEEDALTEAEREAEESSQAAKHFREYLIKQGLDPNISIEKYMKNPFDDDGPEFLEPSEMDSPEYGKILFDNDKGIYYMFILCLNKFPDDENDETYNARIFADKIDNTTNEIVEKDINAKIVKLNDEYPGWDFKKDENTAAVVKKPVIEPVP